MGNAIAASFDRDVIGVTGPDAVTFLQGQVSADVAALAVGAATWSLLLDPTGHLVAWVRLRRVGAEEVELDVEAGWGDVVAARLGRYRIRVKAELEDRPGRTMVAVRGLAPADVDGGADGGVVDALPAPGVGAGVVGFDLVGLDPVAPDGVTFDADAIEEYRIAHGVPAHGAELDDTVIPAEMGRWFVEESVSWTKGCYTGQELVARLDARGSTPRRLRALTLSGPAAPGGAVTVDGAVVGTVTSVFGTAALARLGRAVVPPTTVTVAGHAATVAVLAGTDPAPAVGGVDEAAARRRSLI